MIKLSSSPRFCLAPASQPLKVWQVTVASKGAALTQSEDEPHAAVIQRDDRRGLGAGWMRLGAAYHLWSIEGESKRASPPSDPLSVMMGHIHAPSSPGDPISPEAPEVPICLVVLVLPSRVGESRAAWATAGWQTPTVPANENRCSGTETSQATVIGGPDQSACDLPAAWGTSA